MVAVTADLGEQPPGVTEAAVAAVQVDTRALAVTAVILTLQVVQDLAEVAEVAEVLVQVDQADRLEAEVALAYMD